MESADLVLLLFDITQPLQPYEEELLLSCPKNKTILVWNKCDLSHTKPIDFGITAVCISAKENYGVDTLKDSIEAIIWKKGPPSLEEIIITNIRHKQSIENAILALTQVADGLKNEISPEFISADMRKVLIELGTIIGTDISEDILSSIFSKFCVGK